MDFRIHDKVTVTSVTSDYLLKTYGNDILGKTGVVTGVLQSPDGHKEYSVRLFGKDGRILSPFLKAENIAHSCAEGETK